jgi:hypothetical protein
MMILRIKLPTALSLAALSFAFLVSFGFFNEAKAICNGKCNAGYVACQKWCTDHNNTLNSQLKCGQRCDDYWLSGKNPQSIGRSDPNQSEPPRKVDPGKLKNPPTTVSNPNSPQPPTQIREKKK